MPTYTGEYARDTLSTLDLLDPQARLAATAERSGPLVS
jgi:hypothetical protein